MTHHDRHTRRDALKCLGFGTAGTLFALAGGVLTLIVAGLHKARKKEGRPEVPYGVAIAFGGLWLLAQRFLNHFA